VTAHYHTASRIEPVDRRAKNHPAILEAEFGVAANLLFHPRVGGPSTAHSGLGGDGGIDFVRRRVDGNDKFRREASSARRPGSEYSGLRRQHRGGHRPHQIETVHRGIAAAIPMSGSMVQGLADGGVAIDSDSGAVISRSRAGLRSAFHSRCRPSPT
jgi:hypothetical protein